MKNKNVSKELKHRQQTEHNDDYSYTTYRTN